jgi:hypothetical protein
MTALTTEKLFFLYDAIIESLTINGGGLASESGTVALSVTGAAVAHDATISNCDFSGGTELDATDGCTDGLGNTNVDFGVQANTTACLFLL